MGEAIELRVLDKNDCLRLLAGHVVGRVVFTEAAMPAAVPVRYILDDEEVLFHADRQLANNARNSVVAFEVDDIDPDTHTGWNVVGIGEAYEVRNPARLAQLTCSLPERFTDRTMHMMSIPLQVFSGQHYLTPRSRDQLCSDNTTG
ncbi:MAG TPA: pyridoxamine 5'-phosphate oxidase family protein [Pseudonocardiaceae bacterium]|jgi:nitroimidazol reductase NimA-like FMN-containing flavoprotein (pyridoxamine 5'-phosphate oxidase superfamily)